MIDQPILRALLARLAEAYRPLSVILYGSYADGSATAESDLDALVIVSDGDERHDTAVVDGVPLDVWVYPASHFAEGFDPEEVLQIHDGVVVLDTEGIGAELRAQVAAHVAAMPLKDAREIREELVWCRKMLRRAAREDAEGLYRHHWLLTESLEIACDVLHRHYLGPKKSLRWLREAHPAVYAVYTEALRAGDLASLEAWVVCLEALEAR